MDNVNLPETMQAVVVRGRELELTPLPLPLIEPDGVLLEVLQVGFCGSDHSLIKSGGLQEGTILGHFQEDPVRLDEGQRQGGQFKLTAAHDDRLHGFR